MLQKIDRLIYMDYLIRIEGTGNMKLFAKKLNISRSTCGAYLKLLRDMGGKISYCHSKGSYKYEEIKQFIIGYQS